jgi:hypothetical protein
MRIYSLYFATAVTLLASASAEATARIGRYRADDGNWFLQAMEALAGITYY